MNIFSTNTLRLSYEGCIFVCTNPTPGTPIATSTSVQTSFSATKPHLVIKNNAPVTSTIRAYLHSLNILQIGGTAPATTTSVQAAVVVDSADRTPSAGSQTLTPVNTVLGGKTSVCQVFAVSAANLTAPTAGSAASTVARRQIKGGATVVLDEYELQFGSEQPSVKMANGAVGTFTSSLPPICLLPQQFALLHLWFPGGATNAFTHEFELVLSER